MLLKDLCDLLECLELLAPQLRVLIEISSNILQD